MTKLNRESYIESEFAKWNEKYEIGFEQEFEVRALLSLQYQFITTPNDHVKAKADIINTIGQIKRNLNLKTKPFTTKDGSKYKILIHANDFSKRNKLSAILEKVLSDRLTEMKKSTNMISIESEDIIIEIGNPLSGFMMGKSGDMFINLCDKEFIENNIK